MSILRSIFILSGLGLLSTSCELKSKTYFELLDPLETGVDFENKLVLNDSFNILEFDYIYNGGGVAIGDFNNDTLPDLFFTGNQVSCRMYLNKGNMQFQDVSEQAGIFTSQWAEGVTLADINHDGWLDIYVSTSSGGSNLPNQNLLFVNQGINDKGIPTYSEEAAEYGIDDSGYNTQAAFFDYNRDGYLDLYVLTNALENFNRNTTRPKKLDGTGNSTDKLYRNNGSGTFTNVSASAGILAEGYGLGIVITDINKDNWPDVYLANDFVTNDLLYINNGDGTFTNRIREQMKHQSHNGMGVDAADYNNDGWMDVMVLDMMPETNLRQKSMMFPFASYDRYQLNLSMGYQPQYVRNTLQLNNGNGSFSEIGHLAGVHQTDWSWAPLFADLDNDGLKDLFVTNGYGKDITDMDYVSYSQSLRSFGTEETKRKALLEEINTLKEISIHNYLFRNNGDLTFSDKTEDWGTTQSSISNGASFADLDKDGDLDLVVNNINNPAFIYKNNTIEKGLKGANYLKISLKGDSLNKQGLGSKITLFYRQGNKQIQQYHEHYLTRGYKSTVDETIHFGLDTFKQIDSLKITWPDGNKQTVFNIQSNSWIVLKHRDATKIKHHKTAPLPPFSEVSDSLGITYIHQAEDFVDFKIQPLLPHKHSENGPGIAVGDVNGDGFEDFYTGGSPGFPGKLFVRKNDGKYRAYPLSDHQQSDDMGALFFDADNDEDLDLYIVSGGSRYPKNAPEYLDRLYFNDGLGAFTYDQGALPAVTTSGSVVTAADFDRDGDLDLFVGGRLVPHEYPLPAKSYLLENRNGRFEDVTGKLSPKMEKLGLVTSALWTDVDQDAQIDLLIAGEWMPLTIFKQSKDVNGKIHFSNITDEIGLSQTHGWWNSLQGGDFDNDGDIDYVAGNLGLNSRYKASEHQPVSLYSKDFDENGELDPIMFYYNQGEKYPAHTRNKLISQIAAMRGRFPKYKTYGSTSFNVFFREDELQDAYILRSNEFRSSYIENTGGEFMVRSLPVEVQFAPTYGMIARDVNIDGNLDLLLVGNSFATEMYTGRYDAGYGNYLIGDGHGNFTPLPTRETGFLVEGNARALTYLKSRNGQTTYLITRNQGKLLAFSPVEENPSGRIIKLPPLAQHAEVEMASGQKYYHEFYHGSSYLSQTSRTLSLSDEVIAVTLYDYNGDQERINLNDMISLWVEH